MVQIVLQPTFGALVVKLPPTGNKEQQVVPENTTTLRQTYVGDHLMKMDM